MSSDKVKMEVNIAGEILLLTVPISGQEAVRNTEAELAALHRAWSSEFPGKTPRELLAMMAYRFASAYFALKRKHEVDTEEAERLLEAVTRMCGENADDEADLADSSEFPIY